MSETPQRGFWEQRLAGDWTLSGVGYQALGRPFNTWIYRVRAEVFRRALAEISSSGLDLRSARVLDVGSGTGFYVALWRAAGAPAVTGIDLTQAAVDNLRRRFPECTFLRADISEPLQAGDLEGAALRPSSFDAVSAMDMLFHITDDERYRAALLNLGRLTRPGGMLLLSENFVRRGEQRGPHQVNRTLAQISRLLDEAGFDVLRRSPMLVLMNAQVDAPYAWRKAWGGFLRAVTLTRPTGWAAGALLAPVERRLVRLLRESPTTELMVCRRR